MEERTGTDQDLFHWNQMWINFLEKLWGRYNTVQCFRIKYGGKVSHHNSQGDNVIQRDFWYLWHFFFTNWHRNSKNFCERIISKLLLHEEKSLKKTVSLQWPRDSKSMASDSKSVASDSKSVALDSKSMAADSKSMHGVLKCGIGSQTHGIGSQKGGIRSKKHCIGSQMSGMPWFWYPSHFWDPMPTLWDP